MTYLLSAVAMIFLMGIFISFIVICGTLQAEEEAEKRKVIKAQAKRNLEKSLIEGNQNISNT